jgi:hypothetical protein
MYLQQPEIEISQFPGVLQTCIGPLNGNMFEECLVKCILDLQIIIINIYINGDRVIFRNVK